ncbi:MAPK kinase substrate protein At1g80180-like [Coffea arabica]|uniref:MAPK kinase substrate protein At1g80180-like n=1 Tax=Coffea arabica TaxID=13443 RepID=A0A6P6SXC6_COFAR|nr:MAPK kinase substrate protein At1g80180-like [Coffea arabica]
MAGLQRSEMSFRRQGSSGLVWDDKLLSGELRRISTSKDDEAQQQKETKVEPREAKTSAYRTVNLEPAFDPPSPRVSGCCGIFGGKPASKSQKRKHGRRKS